MRFLQAPGPRVTSAGLIVQEACIAPFLRQPPSVEQNWSNFCKIATLRRNMPAKRLTADNDKRTIKEGRVVADSLLHLLLLLPSLPPRYLAFRWIEAPRFYLGIRSANRRMRGVGEERRGAIERTPIPDIRRGYGAAAIAAATWTLFGDVLACTKEFTRISISRRTVNGPGPRGSRSVPPISIPPSRPLSCPLVVVRAQNSKSSSL